MELPPAREGELSDLSLLATFSSLRANERSEFAWQSIFCANRV